MEFCCLHNLAFYFILQDARRMSQDDRSDCLRDILLIELEEVPLSLQRNTLNCAVSFRMAPSRHEQA